MEKGKSKYLSPSNTNPEGQYHPWELKNFTLLVQEICSYKFICVMSFIFVRFLHSQRAFVDGLSALTGNKALTAQQSQELLSTLSAKQELLDRLEGRDCLFGLDAELKAEATNRIIAGERSKLTTPRQTTAVTLSLTFALLKMYRYTDGQIAAPSLSVRW